MNLNMYVTSAPYQWLHVMSYTYLLFLSHKVNSQSVGCAPYDSTNVVHQLGSYLCVCEGGGRHRLSEAKKKIQP